jgi:hypothetical protein
MVALALDVRKRLFVGIAYYVAAAELERTAAERKPDREGVALGASLGRMVPTALRGDGGHWGAAIGTGLPSGGDRRAPAASAALSRSTIILWCWRKTRLRPPDASAFTGGQRLPLYRRMKCGTVPIPVLSCGTAWWLLAAQHEGEQMADAIGLLIFAAVIGSHGFLWWSCHRRGGSPRI